MTQQTRPKIWPTEKPLVVFMVPAERADDYAMIMNQLTLNVLSDLKWDPDSMELVGLISANARQGCEGLAFLDDIGIDPRDVTLIVLWAETVESTRLQDSVPAECGVGTVILPVSGAVVPAVRMPSIEGDWWLDRVNQAYAASVYASLVEHGRVRTVDGTPYVFISCPNVWN